MKIEAVKNLSKLDVVTTSLDRSLDIRRDLHLFAGYVRDREVKRGHRDNSLSKGDARRLARLLSDPEAEAEIEEHGASGWVDFVDYFARQLGLVRYDTKGVYAGYHSREPCFPDNYVEFDGKAYDKLTSMTLARQEETLLESLLTDNQGCASEFYCPLFRGRLDGFSGSGCATGVMPTLDFAAIRRFLLESLARCPIGEWLSVASLLEYLKEEHLYFLIPKKPQFKNERQPQARRYANFRESKEAWGHEIDIREDDPTAFERVEGRYVERFLEGIPSLLGYVDVAYAAQRPQSIFPSLGYLKAFRVSDRLRRALNGKIAEPTLRVTPSFDVYLQSDLYPVRLMRCLAPICEIVSEDATTVLRLDRRKVAAACAVDSKLNVTGLLESIASEPLPANVRRELSDWSAHSDKFILYSGYSLLETDGQAADLDQFRVEKISAGTDLVRSPDKLYKELESRQLAPLRVKHGDKAFSSLPVGTRSAIARQTSAKKKRREPKSKVTLMRVTRVQLLCPNREVLDRLQRQLADTNCPVEADQKRLSLAYSIRYEKQVDQAIRGLKKEFEVKIADQ